MGVILGGAILVAAIGLCTVLKRIEALQIQNDLELKRLVKQLKDEPGVTIELGGSEIAAIIAKKMQRERGDKQ